MPDLLSVGDQQTSNCSFRQCPIFREVLKIHVCGVGKLVSKPGFPGLFF
jgi:hypothetical protein